MLQFWIQASSEAQWQVPQNDMASATTEHDIQSSQLDMSFINESKHEISSQSSTSCSLSDFSSHPFIPSQLFIAHVMQ